MNLNEVVFAHGHEGPDQFDPDQTQVDYRLRLRRVAPTQEEWSVALYDQQSAGKVMSAAERNMINEEQYIMLEVLGCSFVLTRRGQVVTADELFDDESWSGYLHPLIDSLLSMQGGKGYDKVDRWYALLFPSGELAIELEVEGDVISFTTITKEA
jgi:hypothetical protein